MNALFANLIWATPDMFQSESVFETRVEKFFAERVSTIDLLTDEVQLSPAFEQEIQAVTSRRETSIFAEERFAEERFVEAAGVDTPIPVANDFAPEFDFIGQNRALQDNDFDAFLADLEGESFAPEKAVAEFDSGLEPCVLMEEVLNEARLVVDTSELIDVQVAWTVDSTTGFATASIDPFG